MSSDTLIPPAFPQPISQNMINNPTFNMISNVNNIHNIVTNTDAFKRLFEYICVEAFIKSGIYDDMKCHPGTREVILERLENWVAAPGNADLLITWLDGPMGSGKTSVAVTMADRVAAKNKLIGSFVFRRGQPGRNEDTRFVATLAYQMALSIPLVRPFIEEQISEDYSILHQSLSQQLDALILTPLRKMRSQNPHIDVTTLPNLIIVDGLDECDPEKKDEKAGMRGKEEQQLGVLQLLHCLALAQDVLPFAILVHSRPEMHIKHWFSRDPHASITNRFTLDSSYNPSDDIRLFVTHSLLSLLDTHPLCLHLRGTKWPYEVQITVLGEQQVVNAIELIVERSEGLFVYVSIVLKFISSKGHQPAERLVQILEARYALHNGPASPYSTLDALYTQILDSISNPQVGRRILKLNDVILDAFKFRPPSLPPLSTLLDLLSISMHDFDYFIQQLASILTHDTHSKFLMFQHSSLAEFLKSREQSQHWCVYNYEPEIAHEIALTAVKSFSIGTEPKTQFFYLLMISAALPHALAFGRSPEDWQSSDLFNELKGFFDFQNSCYRTPVLRILASSPNPYLQICFHIFSSLKHSQHGPYLKEWIDRFGSHIGRPFKPHIKRYLKNSRTFAMLIAEAFCIPASNTDYTEDIPPATDRAFAFGKLFWPEWEELFDAPAELLLHVFSIRNLDFLCEAFTILLKHVGQPSVTISQGSIRQIIYSLEFQDLISPELWLTILDCDEYLTPYVRGQLHERFIGDHDVTFRRLRPQQRYCPNPILPFQIALGNCYWEPPNNTYAKRGDTLWFLKESVSPCQQIVIPSVPTLARYMAYCYTTGESIPVPKHDGHCACSPSLCFNDFPEWMRF